MDSVINDLESNGAYQKLKSAYDILDENLMFNDSLTLEARSKYERAKTVCQYITSRMEYSIAGLISSMTIEEINTYASRLISNLRKLKPNQHGWSDEIMRDLDGLLLLAGQIPIPLNSSDLHLWSSSLYELTSTADRYNEQMQESLSNLNRRTREVVEQRDQVSRILSEILRQREVFEKDMEQFWQKSNGRLEEALSGVLARHIEDKDRLLLELRNELEKFRKVEGERLQTAAFRAEEIVKSTRDKMNNALTELQDNAELKTAQILSEVENYQNEAASILGYISGMGIAGSYNQAASEAEKQYQSWRRWTMIAFGVAILVTLGELIFEVTQGAFSGKAANTINWSFLSARVLLLGSIFGFASYSAKQASVHLQDARANRQMELMMKSLDPFLHSLNDEAQQQVKVALAPSLFANREVATAIDSKDVSAPTADALKTILEGLASFIKK